jgi:hypothetical protein
LLEHNMAAVSKIYANISFTELSNLLKLNPDVVEKVRWAYCLLLTLDEIRHARKCRWRLA